MWKHPSCTFPLLSWVIRLLFSSPSIPFHSTHSLFASQVLYLSSRLSVAGNHHSFSLEPFLELCLASSGLDFYWHRSLQAVGWGSSCWGWGGITAPNSRSISRNKADTDKRQQSCDKVTREGSVGGRTPVQTRVLCHSCQKQEALQRLSAQEQHHINVGECFHISIL